MEHVLLLDALKYAVMRSLTKRRGVLTHHDKERGMGGWVYDAQG
jgi:hypothetical protein